MSRDLQFVLCGMCVVHAQQLVEHRVHLGLAENTVIVGVVHVKSEHIWVECRDIW